MCTLLYFQLEKHPVQNQEAKWANILVKIQPTKKDKDIGLYIKKNNAQYNNSTKM